MSLNDITIIIQTILGFFFFFLPPRCPSKATVIAVRSRTAVTMIEESRKRGETMPSGNLNDNKNENIKKIRAELVAETTRF